MCGLVYDIFYCEMSTFGQTAYQCANMCFFFVWERVWECVSHLENFITPEGRSTQFKVLTK